MAGVRLHLLCLDSNAQSYIFKCLDALAEPVTFTVVVVAGGPEAIGNPSGTVQFAVDGLNVGAPVILDAKGRARWLKSSLKVGKHRVTASYMPSVDSVFLPSTSVEKIHIVKRCPCREEHEKK